MPEKVHNALIEKTLSKEVILHLSRDSTAIDGWKKPQRKKTEKCPTAVVVPKHKGRPKKEENRTPTALTRIEKQKTMSIEEMIKDLPKTCNIGSKRDSKGNVIDWIGYKLHLDIVDGGIPVSALLTSASLHDSQAAIPLAKISTQKITNLYDLMDSAYDVEGIHQCSLDLEHVPLIDKNPRGNKTLQIDKEAEAKAHSEMEAGRSYSLQ